MSILTNSLTNALPKIDLAKLALLLVSLCLSGLSFATATAARQDEAALRQAVEQFLIEQSKGLPGDVNVTVGPVDPRLFLASCPGFETFLPPGSKAWGRTTVGVRCNEAAHWTVYISAMVHVNGDYVAAVTPLAQGQQVSDKDIAVVHGDLTALPPGIVTNPAQAIGLTVARSVPAGMPVRQDALKSQPAVTSGQVVRLVSNGDGFSVSAEGRALSSAGEGQVVQARAANGQVVSGIARLGGNVEVNY
ncbi:MAG: flagellar basal body P-ring formation protein FlgA [Burkholderiaceae bacterium]|nr:flagellar basal body P-ring formation protein FlgA [Burkholderiaceae bacterium]